MDRCGQVSGAHSHPWKGQVGGTVEEDRQIGGLSRRLIGDVCPGCQDITHLPFGPTLLLEGWSLNGQGQVCLVKYRGFVGTCLALFCFVC